LSVFSCYWNWMLLMVFKARNA
jgi:hypothetical protein